MQKTLGGDRLGSGKKMKVDLHGYERSTHNLGYIWRSTMAAGTIVPFINEVALPGDTFDIDLDCVVKTHPTVGPLFGSYKVQLDVFQCPIRLYQGQLHNNKLGIGMNMSAVKLPLIRMYAAPVPDQSEDVDNAQINPSCLLAYLGIRGVGRVEQGGQIEERDFNAVPYLAYWDIYKNYYANKQEEIGAGIHTPRILVVQTITAITVDGVAVPQVPGSGNATAQDNAEMLITYAGTSPDPSQIVLTINGTKQPLLNYFLFINDSGTELKLTYLSYHGPLIIESWDYVSATESPLTSPRVATFPLENIDKMREAILGHTQNTAPYVINVLNLPPYEWLAMPVEPTNPSLLPYLMTQEGLGLKTYQSDLFNNWLSTEWIDGPNGITEITSIDTSGGSFSIDTLNLSKKVYNMLNRIAVSGGTYDDWLDAVYAHDRYTRIESPVYHGGLIKELVFQEVVSNSESGAQPLGTLAGKGVMADKRKGGNVYIKVDEPSIILANISLTPRIDYSQGNKWHVHLMTMDDFHKPALDEIGFQELITEQMAWWDTEYDGGWSTRSAGKQPAWINYMTNVNQCLGNFAVQSNEMFMTLNRRYTFDPVNHQIKDLTTYIDPTKFNHIFAQTSIDAQNFWVQISVDMTVRRKMSAKIMPNL